MALITTDYGTDIRISKVVSLSSGLRNLQDALIRRLSTARGSLFYDPDYGLDLRLFVNQEINADVLDQIRASLEQQLELDERVKNIDATVKYDASNFKLNIRIQVTPNIGQTFILVVSVDKLTVELLTSSLNQ